MNANSCLPAEIQKGFVQRVQSISAHTRGIGDDLALMFHGLRDCMGGDSGPTRDLLYATSQLSSSTMKSFTSLDSCLSDLVNMGEATLPVLADSPEAAPALLLNFFSAFVTQMGAFYKEMSISWDQGRQSFGCGKSTLFKMSPLFSAACAAPTPTASASRAGAPPEADVDPDVSTTVDASTSNAGRRKRHGPVEMDVEGKGLPHQYDSDNKASSGTTVSKKRGMKKTTADIEVEKSTPVAATWPAKRPQDPLDASQSSQTSCPSGGHTATALEEAAESGVRTAAPQRAQKKNSLLVPSIVDASAELTPGEVSALARSEPPYLLLTSTLEAALGATVMTSRPKVFGSMASFTHDEPLSTYYIRLVRPGSLAYFVYCNYIRGRGDMQADFLCDVLEADCVEVDPFVSLAGEVVVEDAADLSSLPACAWGIGSSEDNERRLYTMYALVKQPPRIGPTAIIQDSLNVGADRDEVLHMVTLVDDAPGYARVTCLVSSEARTAVVPSQKQAAILSFSRSGFAQAGFVEVPESEVKAAVLHMKHNVQSAVDAKISLLSNEEMNAMTSFQPPVQLAHLAQPANDAGISLGGVARGAMQGGYEVLKMPLTVGRAVGSALLDVTGVTEAVRNNMEGVFRKGFPNLGSEALVDFFNCAWVERSMPRQGYLFITPHWLCFQSAVSASNFSVEYDEIKDIVKSKSAKIFENAIEVQTHLNDSIFLTNFVKRDQAYNSLMSQWLKS